MKFFTFLALSLLSASLLATSPVWRIVDGNKQLYLAGTIHVLRASDFPLPRALDKAYAQAQRLVFETDIAQTRSSAFNQKLLQALRLPPDTTLDQILTSTTLTRLQAYAQKNALNFDVLKRFKPSMIAISLTLGTLQQLGIGESGVDEFYFSRAAQDHKPTFGLETPQQQLEFLARLGKGMEDDMILQTLDEIDQLHSEFPKMVDSWKNGDTRQMETLFIQPMKQQFAPIYQQLLVQRNQAWMPQIKRLLQTPETEMILVGSAHLIGPDGLLKQLRDAGYRVIQQP